MITRRTLLHTSAALLAPGALPSPEQERKARVAITLDLEMSRNFPSPDQTHWDYEKGNLNRETIRYTVEACRRIKAHGGVAHCFLVGRALEQEDVGWLEGLAREGHRIGNHTYDHVNVTATRPEETQFRFRRAPWLVEGKSAGEVIRENIRLTNAALKTRLSLEADGFRTPGGFPNGLAEYPHVRRMLLDLGFRWVSSKYPAHPVGEPGREPTAEILQAIARAQGAAQPYRYPDGLIELPMSPISDINAFRNGRWKLDWFLRAIDLALDWTLERGAVFDFLAHPSCLYVVDPEFRAVERICERVRAAGKRAVLTDLSTISRDFSTE